MISTKTQLIPGIPPCSNGCLVLSFHLFSVSHIEEVEVWDGFVWERSREDFIPDPKNSAMQEEELPLSTFTKQQEAEQRQMACLFLQGTYGL